MVETTTLVGIHVGESNQKPGLLNGGANGVCPLCYSPVSAFADISTWSI